MTSLILFLQFVCLSLWIGGSAALVVITAPSVFRTTPILQAGELMSLVMRSYTALLASVQVLLLASLYLQLLVLSDVLNLKLRLALSITSLATLLTVYLRFVMLPKIDAMRSTLPEVENDDQGRARFYYFRRSQGRSMVMLASNLFLGLCVVITLIVPF